MGARKKRGRSPRSSTITLLRRAAATALRALPRVGAVILAVEVPTQLFLAWVYLRLGIERDVTWQLRYQGLADMIVGSLAVPATYVALRDVVDGSRRGLVASVVAAYRAALRRWVGTFVTRLMVAFVVIVAAFLPVIVGYVLLGELIPDLRAVLEDPAGAFAAATPTQQLLLLLPLPLGAGGVVVTLWYALAEPVVALEGVDGFGALERSKALTSGRRWQVLAGMLVFGGPVLFLDQLLGSVGADHGVWLGAVATCTVLVSGVFPSAFAMTLFVEQSAAVGPLPRLEAGEPTG